MGFHIIPVANSYHQRRVPCHQTGRYHRHKTHIEQYIRTLCGKEVVKDRDEYCSISTADPDWPNAWCQACVESTEAWTPEEMKKWQAKGFFQES